ncbi:MAG: sulfatase-like hydrolase/transferase [Candidatus Rariloculaceae bacterium]
MKSIASRSLLDLFCWCVVLLLISTQSWGQETERPNILFIVGDDLGFTDLGSFGGEISTPNLDRLAYQGLRFTNLHAASACRSTRLMLMAGVSSAAAREPISEAFRGSVLGLDYATIAELLQDAGYSTYMTGKWDLGNLAGYTPTDRGFDRAFSFLTNTSGYFADRFRDDFEEDGRALRREDLPADYYATRAFTDKMLEYLSSTERGRPWFAFMPYNAPHSPLQLPEDWLNRYASRYDAGYDALREERFARAVDAGVIPSGADLEGYQPIIEPWSNLTNEEQRRYARAQEIYAGVVEYLDMSIGRVIDYLEESGQLDNTVIVFSADHGASPGEHGVDTGRTPRRDGGQDLSDVDNRIGNFGRPGSFIDHGRGFAGAATVPFKYQKGSVTEGGLRAAAFVYYPRAVPAGGVSNAFMTVMDILPTFLEIAGTKHPGAGPYRDGREINDIAGRSAWLHLTGKAARVHSPDYAAGWTIGRDGGALIRGDYKIVNTPPPGGMGTIPWQLYNLETDPGERHDIAAENPDLVAELVAEWEADWR